jgi:hypothetical protein
VGVLDVVHRVLVGLRLGQVEVEIEVLVGLAQHVEEAAGVVADFGRSSRRVTNSPERVRHRGLLAVAVEHGELHQRHFELAGGSRPSACNRALHARM